MVRFLNIQNVHLAFTVIATYAFGDTLSLL